MDTASLGFKVNNIFYFRYHLAQKMLSVVQDFGYDHSLLRIVHRLHPLNIKCCSAK